ncbi:MAG: WXG100 family type VII secretion target [Nocardiopsaceae bacterium]|nr:WXG100 family type VII secretion target [Nocardiopsaceae bacterium]
MPYIRADLGALADSVDQFAETKNAFDAAISDLEAQLAASLSLWTGAAREAYDTAHQAWLQASSDMFAELDWLHQVLQTAQGNFGNALTTTTAMWQAD